MRTLNATFLFEIFCRQFHSFSEMFIKICIAFCFKAFLKLCLKNCKSIQDSTIHAFKNRINLKIVTNVYIFTITSALPFAWLFPYEIVSSLNSHLFANFLNACDVNWGPLSEISISGIP